MLKLYGDIISGNCYKAYLLASFLETEFSWCPVNIMRKEASTQEFIQKNPNAKVPLLELENGAMIAESNAILNYLAFNTQFLPHDQFINAKILEWQFFEQYSHEPYIAVARFINKYQGLPESRREEYESKQVGGHKALKIMDHALNQSQYLVGNILTIADISLYAYTHVAIEGGFDLAPYTAINRWLEDVQAQPNYVGMELRPEHDN